MTAIGIVSTILEDLIASIKDSSTEQILWKFGLKFMHFESLHLFKTQIT